MVGPNNVQNTSFGPKTIYILKKTYGRPKKSTQGPNDIF